MVRKKLCRKCKTEKSLKEMVIDRTKKGGHSSICKECEKIRSKQYRTENKETLAKKAKEYGIKNRVAISERGKKYREKNKKALTERSKIYRTEHRESIAARKKRWCLKNRKHVLAKKKQWYKENKERCSVMAKQRYEKHKEEIAIRSMPYRIKNKEHIKRRFKKWCKTERGKVVIKLCHHRRKQHKKNLTTDHDLTTQEWLDIVSAQNNKCTICGEPFPILELTIDHILPISRGGLLVKENVQALCRSCNSSKKDKTMEEYMQWRKVVYGREI